MKVAICLQGLCEGKNDKGHGVSFEESYNFLKKNVIGYNNVDIFIHTWSEKEETIKSIKAQYEPKKSVFEKQILFDTEVNKKHSTKSRWFSHMKSVELKRQYEKENSFVYDYVLVSRFDNCFLTPFVFQNKQYSGFYSSEWIYPHNVDGFLDYWFFSDSKTMDDFSNLYEKVDEYLNSGVQLSNHVLSKHHAISIGLENKLKHIKKEHVDFCLERQLAK